MRYGEPKYTIERVLPIKSPKEVCRIRTCAVTIDIIIIMCDHDRCCTTWHLVSIRAFHVGNDTLPKLLLIDEAICMIRFSSILL